MRRADDCPSLEELERFAADALDGTERARLAAHCSSCVDCRARADEVSSHFALEARLKSTLDLRPPAQRLVVPGFRVVRELARGGMGVVYEAEQLAPKRRVALKVVRGSAYATERTHALFQREIEALARLSHPCIAALFGAGATDDGEPWFAMELVEGAPLTSFARTLALRERVALLARIALAVHHAHQRGVVHRDLKPSNVLVGAGGAPKVLDFGLAKILDDERRAGASQSIAGSVRGTLAYMSPEQARGDPDAVDARSDVYTLGVLLYELLAGRMPYELEGLDLLGAARVIQEREVVPPSRFERAASGDLDAIALKALGKDADARYSSAAALAEDLERWSRGEVVLARRPTGAYVLAKLVARHKLAFASAIAFVALLVGFGAWMAVLYRRTDELRVAAQDARRIADEQRQLAETRLATVQEQVEMRDGSLRFITRILGEAQATRSGGDVRVVDVIDRAALALDRAELRPGVGAAIGSTLANIDASFGRYAKAEERLRRCIELLSADGRSPQPEDAAFHMTLFRVLLQQRRLDEAEDALVRSEALLAQAGPANDVRKLVGEAQLNRGLLAARRGALAQAESHYRAAWEVLRDLDRERASECADDLSIVLQDQGKLDDAEPFAREALDGFRELRGDEHVLTLNAQTNYAMLLLDRGELREARELLEQTLAVQEHVIGPESSMTLATKNNLAGARLRLGELEAALEIWREIAQTQERVLGPDDVQTLSTKRNIGNALLRAAHASEAETVLAELVERAENTLPPQHWLLARSRTTLGRAHVALARYDDAESELRSAYDALAALDGANPAWKREAAAGLAELYDAWNKPEQAEPWRVLAR